MAIMVKVFRFFILFIALFSSLACAASEKHRNFVEVVDDAVISNKLKITYFKDKVVKGTKVNIDTRRGVVTLRGRLENQEQIDRAIELAEKQKGVREVKSYLILKDGVEIEEGKSNSGHSHIEEKDLLDKKSEPSSSSTTIQKSSGSSHREEKNSNSKVFAD
jgi:hypothetical protein